MNGFEVVARENCMTKHGKAPVHTISLPGGRIAEVIDRDSDEQNKSRTVRRVIVADTLCELERRKTITPVQRRAGAEFRVDFYNGNLHGIRPRQMERIDMPWKSDTQLSNTEHATRLVYRDLMALGGVRSRGSTVMWEVVGMERTLRKWCEMSGQRRDILTGILIASLDVIVATRNIS